MYTAEISRSNPSAFLFLIDQSGSMSDPIAGGTKTKADATADAINRLLQNLVIKCSKGDEVRNYFEVGVVGYGSTVGTAFSGALSGQSLAKISDIATNPAKLEDRKRKVDDGMGGLVEQTVKFPIWFEPVATGGTPMCQAITLAKSLLEPWVQTHQNAYPPVVINITDGEPTDGDPTASADTLKALTTSDGHVLLFNCHISAAGGNAIVFPNSNAGLDAYAQIMFHLSSELPEGILKAAKAEGFDAQPGARGFVYNADLVQLIQFLDIGTRPANNLR